MAALIIWSLLTETFEFAEFGFFFLFLLADLWMKSLISAYNG